VTVFARDAGKARAFADEFKVNSAPWNSLSLVGGQFDIVVNATPLGMNASDASPVTADQLSGVKLVFDMVTAFRDTPLISEAKRGGIPAIGGLEMLLAQGARQFEIWMDQAAPVSLMREAALNYTHDR
jgi:shikimate dehydrogenase